MNSARLIPDTNFLVYLVKYRMLDELGPYNLIVINQIIDELKKLSEGKRGKTKVADRVAASIALTFLKTKKVKIERQNGETDDAILLVAKKRGAAIGTMDKELSKKAEKLNIPVIKIRQKKYLY
ncbi:MAG: hypothetical protein K6T16_00865 [Candidatus Pacearchaeota archaeon]|nr:hypothetical protein [Candidatus Pacearchaeota archaeon]